MRNIKIDQDKFSILQYGNCYRAQKKCSITNEIYKVELTPQEFRSYYTRFGKTTAHLNMSVEQRAFLNTTCTPAEVKSLTPAQRKLSTKIWRYQIKKN